MAFGIGFPFGMSSMGGIGGSPSSSVLTDRTIGPGEDVVSTSCYTVSTGVCLTIRSTSSLEIKDT